MSLLPILDIVGKVIDKVIPDKEKAAELKLRAAELDQKGELAFLDADVKLALSQNEINLEEAKSENLFKSGWRPAVGWTCVGGFVYQFIAQPILSWVAMCLGLPALPIVDTGVLITMLTGLLGLGTLRTYEKYKGVHKD